jgi:hypothetical protein
MYGISKSQRSCFKKKIENETNHALTILSSSYVAYNFFDIIVFLHRVFYFQIKFMWHAHFVFLT